MYLFVGDKASNSNVNPNIAFVGTRSYMNLLEWIFKMDISVNDITLINSDDTLLDLSIQASIKVICLGRAAESVVSKKCINYFVLPHPSPRNLQLNDELFVLRNLKECKKYIDSKILTSYKGVYNVADMFSKSNPCIRRKQIKFDTGADSKKGR